MKQVNLTTIAIVIVAVLSTGLLFLGRVDFDNHQRATVANTEYRRGEVISSGDEFVDVEFGSSMIYLDKNTEVKIIDGRADQETINVIQGRVVVNGALMITTREVRTIIDGRTSLVHYSWLDEIDIASLDGKTRLELPGSSENISGSSIKVGTMPPYSQETIEFDPESSSAAEFYSSIGN